MSANLVDLNGDNKLDLVASGPAENELSVFLGNGDGTFGPELLLTAFSSALVGDFNGDGKPDIATLAGGGGTGAIRLYLGNGDGTFTTAEDTTFSTGYISNVSLVAGDFNGDGRLDIAVTGLGNGASQVYLLMGNGDGTFRPVTSAGSFNQPFGLSVADFDGDGHLDIAVAESGSSAVSILFGNGDGTFQQQAEYPSGGYPNSLAVADFNGDGHPDIAVANSGPIGTAGAVAILLNSGGRVFAPPVSYDVGAGSNSISTDDVNGDGNLDLVFATTQPSRQALLLMGNGDGTFATNPLPLSTTSDWPNTAIGDINGDGAPDVVIPNGNGGLTILLQSVAPVVKIAPMGLQFAAVSGGAAPPPQSVAISNAGAGTVAWTATTSQPWIALGQSAGTAPANLTVSVNPSGLAPGTYSAIVTVAATGASNSPQTVTVELTLSAPPVVPVALSLVPASIVGPGNSAGTVTLSGPAPTGGAAVALSVDTSVVQVPSIVSVAAGLTSASFTLSALAPVSTTTAVVTASYNAVATSASLIVQPGIAAATLFPTKLTFGAIVGSSSQAKTVTLSNSGTTTLSLGGIAASGDYVQGNKCPPSLAPGLSCVIAVAFRPSTGGVVLGALTISDNAGNSPQIVNLSGVGVNSVSTSPSNFAFGTVTVGAASKPQVLTVTNNSAAAVSLGLTASADYLVGGSGTAPCGPNLAARASCTAMITFTPSQNGFIAGTIAISGPSFATQLLTLTGSGAGGAPSPFAFSPSYVNFTSQLVSTTSASQTVTITNVAATTVNILSMAASAGFAAAGGASQPCGGALAAHATCTFAVTFTPSAIGATDGSVAFMTNSRTGPLIYTLLGTGVPPVTLTPASLTFGAQSVGTISPPQTVTLLNNQGAALSLTSLTGSGTYTVTSGGNTPCGRTVAAHSTCTFQVTFSPTSTGTIMGSITIADDAKGSPQVLSLVGTAQ